MKAILINTMIVILYGFGYYYMLKNVSGGDILLTFLFTISILLHVVCLFVKYIKKFKMVIAPISGVIIGFIICMVLFKLNEKSKRKQLLTVEPISIGSTAAPGGIKQNRKLEIVQQLF